MNQCKPELLIIVIIYWLFFDKCSVQNEMQKNICLSLYDPKYLCSPFQQTTCLFFPLSDFWLLGEVQWSALLLSSSKTEKCIEVKRGAKHSVGHESQLVSNMSTLFPLFLWNLLFLLMVFLSSWSLETIQTVEKKKKKGEKIVLFKSPLRGTKKGGRDFQTYSWGHTGSNAQLNEWLQSAAVKPGWLIPSGFY